MTNRIWKQHGRDFYPGDTNTQVATVAPGIYKYCVAPGSWWLEQTNERFEFPYKIYGVHSHIIDRVSKAWGALDNNLGILLNGTKGTGKSVTAKLIANWAIEQGYAVLNVDRPVPLDTIFKAVTQPLVVIFDEFEKTHDADAQKVILSVLDGMSTDKNQRLYIFTSNNRTINSNLEDRPGRIRYGWEFDALSVEVINEIIDDHLNPELVEYKSSIIQYLSTRKILSIDVVKTVISEVNIFREPATQFNGVLNLSEKLATHFTISAIMPNETEAVVSYYFKPGTTRARSWLMNCLIPGNKEAWEEGNLRNQHASNGVFAQYLYLAEPTSNPQIWKGTITVSVRDTWIKKFPKALKYFEDMNPVLRLNSPSADFEIPPEFAEYEHASTSADRRLEIEESIFDCMNLMYEGGNNLLLRIEPQYESFTYAKAAL